jgi:hypothetical protein
MRRYSDSQKRAEPARAGLRLLRGLVLVPLAFGLSGTTAGASPIKHHRVSSAKVVHPETAWERFLAGGPAHWAKSPSPTMGAGIHHLMHEALKSADPVAHANVEYLMWRRSLDPARFDSFHPRIGPTLQALLPTSGSSSPTVQPEQLLPTPTTSTSPSPSAVSSAPSADSTAPSATDSSTPTSPSGTEGISLSSDPSLAPAAIPEPGTLSIALVLLASVLLPRSGKLLR